MRLRRFAGPPARIGWHADGDERVQVAQNAAPYRTPEPRHSAAAYPLRSTYGLFALADDGFDWRILEENVPYLNLEHQHAPLAQRARLLVAAFSPASATAV